MSDLNLTSFTPLYPMRIHQYNELINDQNTNVMDKVNSIIDYLNQVGKLTNDVVKDWNTVYNWVMNEGLTTDVNNKLEAMLANHEFDPIMNTILTKMGDLTTLTTTAKDTIVNAINSLQSDMNTKIGDLTTLQTVDKSSLVHAVNENTTQLTQKIQLCMTANDLINTLSVSGVSNLIINLKSDVTYTLTSLLNITNAQNIIINGNGATIDGGLLFKGSYAKNIVFKDINFITTQNVDLVKFICEMDNVLFDRCTFSQNSTTYGGLDAGLIYFNAGTANINGLTITKCSFTSNAGTNFRVAVKLHNSGSSVANNVEISNCYFNNIAGFGVESNCGNNLNISNCRFINCKGATSSGNAGVSMVSGTNISITDSKFISCGWGIEATGQQFIIDNCYFTGTLTTWNIINDATSTDLIISNCKFYAGRIGTSGGSNTLTNLNITGCKFLQGASIELDYAVSTLILLDCYFTASGTSNTQFFWYSTGSLLTGVVIKNNIIDTSALTSTQYSFRFNPSQNKDEITMLHNEVLGTFGLGDIRTNETESSYKSHNAIGGYVASSVYMNRVVNSIAGGKTGFILTIDPNSHGGVPQGFIKLHASLYNANNVSKYGEYRLVLGTYSSATGGVSSSSILNTAFGDLTVSSTSDGSGHINITVTFGTPANITDTLSLLFEMYGVGTKIVYRGFAAQ